MPNPLTIAGLKLTPILRLASGIAGCLTLAVAQPLREAPNSGAQPVNQLSIAGNACGPAAMLAAFRFGNESWQRAGDSIAGENDKQRLSYVIRKVAMRPSRHLGGRPRWSKSGVNVADLCDIGNELTAGLYLPQMRYEVLFLKPKESQERLLARVHDRLGESLAKGLPPVISIRRFAKQKSGWTIIDGHFVTVISMPKKLEKNARSFAVTYLDPWGGKRSQGQISISDRGFLAAAPAEGQVVDPMLSPCLEAVFPQALVGRGKLQNGEETVLTLSAAIGRW